MAERLRARTPILVLILLVFGLGYTFAHNKVVVVPLGDAEAASILPSALVHRYDVLDPDIITPVYTVPNGKTFVLTDIINLDNHAFVKIDGITVLIVWQLTNHSFSSGIKANSRSVVSLHSPSGTTVTMTGYLH